MAGWSAQESMSGINDILNLATIGATDLGIASDIVTDGLTSLGMSANQAGNFVDYMAATITSSNTNVEMMGETLKYAGSVAGTLGISMQDLSVAIGLMANSGIKASSAGTSLRTLMSNLSAPTSTVAKAMTQYGISLETASDGSVDLDATLQGLRKTLKELPLAEQAEAAKALAGKTGMSGLLSIVNATDEEYKKLHDSISNATQQVAYWNENTLLAGKTGKDAVDNINMMKEAFEGAETNASAMNLTTNDLALAVQMLGADSKVSADNVNDLLQVFQRMKSPSKEQSVTMENLGITYRTLNDEAFDYSKTCSMIDSSIGKLNQSQKEQVKSQLNTKMSMKEANKVLKQYNLEAQSGSTGQIDLVTNLKELRDTFGGMSKEARKAALEQLGLGMAFEEVNEVCEMSDEDFKLYCDNLELVKSMSEKIAEAMDLTTKGSLLGLASALTDVGINAFEKFKGGLVSVSDELTRFFNTWKGEDLSYSFENFKVACDGLLKSVRNMDLAGAMGTAISNMNNFILNDGLSGILDIGGEIISQICQGIIDNQFDIEVGISSAIKQISEFVTKHAGEVEKAGRIIIDALKKGIEDNTESIHTALDAVAGAMNSWIEGSEQIKSLTGNFASIFIDSFLIELGSKIKGKGTEFWNAFKSVFVSDRQPSDIFEGRFDSLGESAFNEMERSIQSAKEGKPIWKSIRDWFTGESFADEVTEGAKPLGAGVVDGTKQGIEENKESLKQSAKGMSDGAVEGAKEGLAPLAEVMMLQEATQALQQSATDMYNGAKVSFSKLSEVGKQSATDMYNGMSTSFSGLKTNASTSFVGLYNVINNQMTNATNAVRTGFVSMSNVARNQSVNVGNSIRTGFMGISNIISNQMSNARNQFTSQMMSMSAVARNQVTNISNTIRTGFINIYNIINNQAKNARDAFTGQMMSMVAVARNQSKNTANAIRSAFTSLPNQMRAIGIQIGNGLANGIASSGARAVAQARSVANQVASSMRSTLDIHSPSRVTTDIGEDTGQGLINGLDNKQRDLEKAVNINARDMVEGLRANLNVDKMVTELKAVVDFNSSKMAMNIPNSDSRSNKSTINESDIKRLEDAINSKPTVVQVDLDKKNLVTAIAKPIKYTNEKTDRRTRRLEGID